MAGNKVNHIILSHLLCAVNCNSLYLRQCNSTLLIRKFSTKLKTYSYSKLCKNNLSTGILRHNTCIKATQIGNKIEKKRKEKKKATSLLEVFLFTSLCMQVTQNFFSIMISFIDFFYSSKLRIAAGNLCDFCDIKDRLYRNQ